MMMVLLFCWNVFNVILRGGEVNSMDGFYLGLLSESSP